MCKQQINEAKNETVSDEEFERLQNELAEELNNEKLLLKELR